MSLPLSNCFSVSVINNTAKNNFKKKGLVLAYSFRVVSPLWCVWSNIASGTGNKLITFHPHRKQRETERDTGRTGRGEGKEKGERENRK